jgi:23S rRNA (uridine2552-2'-O)-methyltransferase
VGKTRKGLKYEVQDSFYKAAKKAGYVARSVFKLQEMDQRWNFYKKGMRILDLGCAPGSWLQHASERVGPGGRLLGVDIVPVQMTLKNCTTVKADLNELEITDPIFEGIAPFDVVQSDAMVKTVGIADSDVARSIRLVENSLRLSIDLLKPGGTFIAKVFEGPGFTEFYVKFKPLFKKALVSRPDAIRDGSREIYVIGFQYKGKKEEKS